VSKPRLSKEQQQEYRSRNQLASCFDDYGWIRDPISRDLGEDFSVRIYDEGTSSGLAFLVQLKSTENIGTFEISNSQIISYRLYVKDLVHWEASVIPVLIIVWDVIQSTGRWMSVYDAIQDLDNRNPSWRTQKTVRVHIPSANKLDDEGLQKIRYKVAHHFFPIVAKGKTGEMTFKLLLPDNEEGKTVLSALKRHISAGDSVEIDGRYIDRVEFPEWMTRLFGETVSSPAVLRADYKPSGETVPFRLDFSPFHEDEVLSYYIETRLIKAGREEFTISNQHQVDPLHFLFVFRKGGEQFTCSISTDNMGADVIETHRAFTYLEALAKGGNLKIVSRRGGKSVAGIVPKGVIGAPDPIFMNYIDDLCLIQRKTNITLSIEIEQAIGRSDLVKAADIAEILQTGRLIHKSTTRLFRIQRHALRSLLERQEPNKAVKFRITTEPINVKVLDVNIPLGPVTEYVSGYTDVSLEELDTGASDEDEIEVKVIDAEIVEEYINWLPTSEG